jgi:predicted dehydrogenase
VRVLVAGAGSIGTRHERVLRGLGHDVAMVSRRGGEGAYPTIAEGVAATDPGYLVIATETAAHAGGVRDAAAAGFTGRLLVEKPLAVPADALAGFSRVGVGFNLRFHPVIARLRELLAGVTVHTVEAYAGQALGGWRPSRPVTEQYSSSSAAGGGVLRDLSHELDYLGWMLGPCAGVFARGGRLTDITIDADDAWGIVAEFEAAPLVTLQLNYLDTDTRRRIVANTSAGTVAADVIGGTLTFAGETERFAVERDQTYAAMHLAMLGDDAGGAVATPAEAARTDALISLIERSAATRAWVGA